MADTIPCEISEDCNCQCNCQAYFTHSRKLTVESLEIDVNDYEFSYLITNQDPALSNIIFCIQCPTTIFEATSSNTTISVIGNPSGTPVPYTLCVSDPCPDNSYTVEYNFDDESSCCSYQGIKINVHSADDIDEIRFIITFTVPEGIVLSFQPGVLKIKNGQEIGIVNYVCMPGCGEECNRDENICLMWLHEKDIIVSKKDVFSHYSQSLFPIGFDLSTLTLSELEQKIRLLEKLEKSIAKLNCDVAKALEALNKNESINKCCI